MATATEVIGGLKARDVTLAPDGAGGLRVNGISRLTDREKAALKAHKSSLLKALTADSAFIPTGPASPAPVEASLAVTAALPTYTEPPELEPKDRLCYQCQHFARSPYGYPLGLCVEHGNRIQHSTSEPTHFGCGTFEPKEGRS